MLLVKGNQFAGRHEVGVDRDVKVACVLVDLTRRLDGQTFGRHLHV